MFDEEKPCAAVAEPSQLKLLQEVKLLLIYLYEAEVMKQEESKFLWLNAQE